MNNIFLEIVPENFTITDFEKHHLEMPQCCDNGSNLKLIFFTEMDYNNCLRDLENESNNFLSQYCIKKTPELIDKNKFIIKVLTTMNVAKSKKYDSSTGR